MSLQTQYESLVTLFENLDRKKELLYNKIDSIFVSEPLLRSLS